MSGPKKLSDKYLKQHGVDAEKVKKLYGYGSEVDIYKGKTILFMDKNHKLVEDTNLTEEQFFDLYGDTYTKHKEDRYEK